MTQNWFFTRKKVWKKEPGRTPVNDFDSVLDCVRVALVDTCSAVDAFGLVDDSDVVDGDCVLGANVCASSTCNTVVCDDLRHLFHLQFSIASEGHSSTQAPQSTHLESSITATSSTVIAPSGHASAHAPHATQLSATILGMINHNWDSI